MMKKTISLLLVCLLLLGCVPLAAASGCIAIDKTWNILIPEAPTPAETFAANKLGGNVHIAGTAQRGLQIAAYRFLEEFCGRKVYTATITVMPQSDKINVPADTDIHTEMVEMRERKT